MDERKYKEERSMNDGMVTDAKALIGMRLHLCYSLACSRTAVFAKQAWRYIIDCLIKL